ncbi:MAG TPA: GvpL/GvpF family gas vesicle protein [Vicinamibacterales bacterium]|nr:GvpL/GvpF family gas vesicle protein [Vicinamibacterales bacterium]
MSAAKGTYVYCLVSARTRPRLTRVPAGLPGAGKPRLLDVEPGLFAVCADAPLDEFGETSISRGLADLEWVSRAAVAHEAVVEAFIGETAVLPMKLFTIFMSDERVLDHVRSDRQHVATMIKRVANHQEWGVRVRLDRQHATAAAAPGRARTGALRIKSSGIAYLTEKKAQRDAAAERAAHARQTIAALFDRLSARARDARRRTASELPMEGGPLLLDAAFLVPRARAAAFQTLTAREAKSLERQGYGLTVSGPWPPYTFVKD